MKISVTEAKSRLTELVRRAEAGEEVTLTRHDKPAVRLVVASGARTTAKSRRAAITRARASAASSITPGPCAALSQDFLYDENGLPA